MYESFFHLKEQPFGSTPDPRYLYWSGAHREALAYLAYGVFEKKGFLAVTGEVGIGKTTIIRAFIHTFYPCLEVAFVLNTKITFDEMLYLILQDFGCDINGTSKVEMLTVLNNLLLERYAMNRNPVIVIDEAQNLSIENLEELRMLSNLETDQEKLLQIVLVGQPELAQMLNRRELRQLKQRIPGVLRMRNLTLDEVKAYIRFRLKTAGLTNGHLRFTSGAHEAIYQFSGGTPRLINAVCDRVLVRGYLRRKSMISRDMVNDCVEELSGDSEDERRKVSGLDE
ncbi:MAG: AAA family ATPase [bacterium]|nr:AAA family ATPase [bacterium]